jgi:hypothetical protein
MKRLLLYLAAFPLWAACNPIFYSPSSQHIPLLTEEKEFSASASFVTAESTESMALKAAYAISPHWALMAGGSFHFNGETDNHSASGGGGYIEGGAGYFKRIGEKFVFDTYGLVGFGGMNNRFPQSVANYPNTNGRIEAKLLSLAVQPAIGFKSRYFEAALSTRTSLINYRNIQGNLVAQNADQQSPSSQQEYLAAHRNNFLLEPALTLRGGLEFLKLELQTGVSLNLSHPDFPQDASWVSLGLVYNPSK